MQNLINNLRSVLLVMVFLGFIVFGGLVIAVEHRYYVQYLEGKYKYSKLLYWIAVLLTAGILLVMYRIFFLDVYSPPESLSSTAFV